MNAMERMQGAVNDWLGMGRDSLQHIAKLGWLPRRSFESACVAAERWGVSVKSLERACVDAAILECARAALYDGA